VLLVLAVFAPVILALQSANVDAQTQIVRPPKRFRTPAAEKEKMNAWTVGLAGGLLEGAPIRFANAAEGPSKRPYPTWEVVRKLAMFFGHWGRQKPERNQSRPLLKWDLCCFGAWRKSPQPGDQSVVHYPAQLDLDRQQLGSHPLLDRLAPEERRCLNCVIACRSA
jgi:hypothetical protein